MIEDINNIDNILNMGPLRIRGGGNAGVPPPPRVTLESYFTRRTTPATLVGSGSTDPLTSSGGGSGISTILDVPAATGSSKRALMSTDGPSARKLKTSSVVNDSPENELILKFVGQRWRAIAASYQPKGVARLEWQSGQGMRTKNHKSELWVAHRTINEGGSGPRGGACFG